MFYCLQKSILGSLFMSWSTRTQIYVKFVMLWLIKKDSLHLVCSLLERKFVELRKLRRKIQKTILQREGGKTQTNPGLLFKDWTQRIQFPCVELEAEGPAYTNTLLFKRRFQKTSSTKKNLRGLILKRNQGRRCTMAL